MPIWNISMPQVDILLTSQSAWCILIERSQIKYDNPCRQKIVKNPWLLRKVAIRTMRKKEVNMKFSIEQARLLSLKPITTQGGKEMTIAKIASISTLENLVSALAWGHNRPIPKP